MMLSDLQTKDIINVFDGKKIGMIIDVSLDSEGKITEMSVQRRRFIFFSGSTSKINSVLPQQRVVRVMPNTPALLGLGMAGVVKGALATDADAEFVLNLMSTVGKAILVDEKQIDIITAISGSGPAFFYKVIEDMARAGEKLGLDYEKSLLLATQTAAGSAKMVMNRGELTVQTLIDNVATKGGCTFVGIQTMKEENSAKLFSDVIEKTARKANELGK